MKKSSYPIELTIARPTKPRDKVSVFLRLFYLLPIMIMLLFLSGVTSKNIPFGGLVILPTIIMLIIRRKYPRWWYDWNVQMVQLLTRVMAYACLLTDKYPAMEEQQGIDITLPYPKIGKDIQPGLSLIKWFLAIPHYIVLAFLSIVVCVLVIVSWFSILFSGKVPEGIFSFIEGFAQWYTRVLAYAFLLITDIYPPFSLK
jgi:hypothetical protein